MSINKVTISGNLTRDPEVRTTAGGTAVLKFGIAVNDRRKDAEGNWSDYPNFIECTVFGARATALGNILNKGMQVCIDGKLQYSSWEDKETHKNRSKIEVVVNEIDFLSQKSPQASGTVAASSSVSAPVASVVDNATTQNSMPVDNNVTSSDNTAGAASAPATPTPTPVATSAPAGQADSSSFDADIPV